MWDRIQGVRNQELSTLWRSFIIQALFGFTLNTIPVLVSVLTFGVYVLLGNKLTASEAFTSLSLFTVRPTLSNTTAANEVVTAPYFTPTCPCYMWPGLG